MIKDFELILIIITFTTTYVDYVNPMFGIKLDKKPFNCAFCLTIWTTLLIYIFSFSLIECTELILITPLILRVVERRLL